MGLITVLLAGSRDDADREFKSFALMDTHDPYNIRVFIQSIGLAVVNFPVVYLVDIPDKVKDPAQSHFIERSRLSQKKLKICAPLFPAREGPAPLFVSCL